MRNISLIALEIQDDWKSINPAAKPYLEAMFSLDNINDNYFADTGKSVVLYFLANAASWRGEVARRVKKELKELANG